MFVCAARGEDEEIVGADNAGGCVTDMHLDCVLSAFRRRVLSSVSRRVPALMGNKQGHLSGLDV